MMGLAQTLFSCVIRIKSRFADSANHNGESMVDFYLLLLDFEGKERLCQNKTAVREKAAVRGPSSSDSKTSCVFLQPHMLRTSCPPHHITFGHLLISDRAMQKLFA